MKDFKIIVSACNNRGIGQKGALPWSLKKEMQYFKTITTNTRDKSKKNAVIMGRKTWESIPSKRRPLANRLNVVLSRTIKELDHKDVLVCSSLNEAVSQLSMAPISETIEDIWIIGGSLLYKEAINSPMCVQINLTKVDGEFECDTFFPTIPEVYEEIQDENVPMETQEENGISYKYTVLKHKSLVQFV